MGSPLRERCVHGRRRQGDGTEGQEGVCGWRLIGVVESRQCKRRVAHREDGKEEHERTGGELNNIPELIEDAVRSA